MPPVVIVVPAEQVLPVLDGLLALYDTKVDTVSHRVREYLAEEVPAAVLLRERDALARIDVAIEQIGWARMPRLNDARPSWRSSPPPRTTSLRSRPTGST